MDMPPVQYVRTSDGYSLAYFDVGSGTPIVLLPSRLNHIRRAVYRFGPWFAPLAETHRLVHYDPRGQGLSTRGLRADLAFSDYLSDLELILDHVGLEKPVLVAHGFGGHVAVRYTVANPERVAALILATVTVEVRAWSQPLWRDIATENWDLFLRSLAPRNVPDIDAWVAQIKQSETQEDYVRAQSVAAPSSIEDALPRLSVPTLVLHPSDFVMVPAIEATRLAGAIPDSRLVMLGGSGDDFLGDPDEFVAAVRSFLEALPLVEGASPIRAPAKARLSQRETEVLRLIAAGRSNQQIADELVLSLRTVERHITNLYAKIGAHGKADATAYALRHGFD